MRMRLMSFVLFCLCLGVFSKWFEVLSTEKVDGTGFLINAVQQVGKYSGIVLKQGLYQLASCCVFILLIFIFYFFSVCFFDFVFVWG